jgi:hypothetical protein
MTGIFAINKFLFIPIRTTVVTFPTKSSMNNVFSPKGSLARYKGIAKTAIINTVVWILSPKLAIFALHPMPLVIGESLETGLAVIVA